MPGPLSFSNYSLRPPTIGPRAADLRMSSTFNGHPNELAGETDVSPVCCNRTMTESRHRPSRVEGVGPQQGNEVPFLPSGSVLSLWSYTVYRGYEGVSE